MNLLRIKSLAEKKKVAIRQLAIQIDMSEQNLHKCIKENRIEAGQLEKIAQILGVQIGYFFEETDSSISITMEHNGNGHNIAGKDISINECKKEIEHLKEIISLKDEIIEALRSINKG
jgi:DNA-binding Xre family transcriptional regulator